MTTDDTSMKERLGTNLTKGDEIDLTGFQIKLLFSVARSGPSSGTTVKNIMEDKVVGHEVNHGRLYPNLDVLVEHNLINRGQMDRRTNKYTITQEGLEYLRILADESAKAHKAAIQQLNTDSE
jgi:DNA-binding PadR family transcriptional regulator